MEAATAAAAPAAVALTAEQPTRQVPTPSDIIRHSKTWRSLYDAYHFGITITGEPPFPAIRRWGKLGVWSLSRNGATVTDSVAKQGGERVSRWVTLVGAFECVVALCKASVGSSKGAAAGSSDDEALVAADAIMLRELGTKLEVAYEVIRPLPRGHMHADAAKYRPRFVPVDAHSRYQRGLPAICYDRPPQALGSVNGRALEGADAVIGNINCDTAAAQDAGGAEATSGKKRQRPAPPR